MFLHLSVILFTGLVSTPFHAGIHTPLGRHKPPPRPPNTTGYGMHSCLKFKFTKKFPSFIVRPRIKLVDQLFHKIDLIKELHSLLKLIFLCPTVCLVRKVNSGTNLLLKTSGLNIPKGSFNEQQYRMLCSYYFLFRKNETFTCVNVAVKEITP